MRLWITCLLLLASGCGQQQASFLADNEMMDSSESFGWSDSHATAEADADVTKSIAAPQTISPQENQSGKSISTNRKIIYTASMEIVVEVFDGIEQKISDLVVQHNGFVASANLGRMQGERRSGYWTVRVPTDQFDSFLNAAGDIGVPASRSQTASDVTEEFVDLQARITNKKKLEARIIELLERPDDKIQHVIEVERELARVREEVERMEGRLRFLTDQTSLTTITLNIREERNYVPPQAPTLGNRVASAWTTSLINCRQFLENAVVFVVANAIGFGLFVLALIIGIPILRRIWKLLKRHLESSAPAETSAQS